MSARQDKAITERFTRTLRELVKRPENKVCADCKRNDPRWASWNLGVFLCIRCSGIHRGMGTHISKVKSVDLDVWTPEQMESIQKWGNHLANLYWEAHLKAGHTPPEHKMESFIRSKYESRRWALDGPPPADPAVLDNGSGAQPAAAPATPVSAAPAAPASTTTRHVPTASFSSRAPTSATAARQPQSHTHQLLSSNYTNKPAAQPQVHQPPFQQPQQQPKAPENELFMLDFHAPSPVHKPASGAGAGSGGGAEPKKDVKQDILSLFSVPPPAGAGVFGGGAGGAGAFGSQAALWGGGGGVAQQQQQPQGQGQQQQWSAFGGNGGVGLGLGGAGLGGGLGIGGGAASSAWGAPAPIIPAQPNVWGASAGSPQQFQQQFQMQHQQYQQQQLQQQQQQSLFNTNAVWGASATTPAASTTAGAGGIPDLFGASFGGGQAPAQQQQKKADDVFGDIWGGFK